MRGLRSLVCMLFLLLLWTPFTTALELGEAAGPVPLLNLEGLDRVMDNYGERRGTVVAFLSARCLETEAQIREISELHERYRIDELLFVGVVSNPAEDPEEIRNFSQRRGVIFPFYRDPEGEVMAQFGATVSPEFFLLDAEGVLVFRGGLTALSTAAEQFMAGEAITTPLGEAKGTPLSDPAPARVVDDPYGSMRFYSSFVFDELPGVAVNHCPTLAEAPNGDLLCLWYAGSYESSEDQALYLARLPKGERRWEATERVLWNPEQPPGNAVIFRTPDDKVGIVWGRMEQSRPMRRGTGWSECRLLYRTSSDNGHTWSADVEIPDSFGTTPRNVPITLQDGRLALPISGETSEDRGSFLLYLNAGSDTWTRGGFAHGGSQPTIIQRDNGDLLSLMRGKPRIPQSISTDGGATWSESRPTELKNPGSGIAMTRLKSGRIVLVFNDTDQSDRYPLSIIQSFDGGETWEEQRTLEADWGEFSYPSIIQADDGMIHVSYTYRRYHIKHVAFDEGWLTHTQRPN